MKPTPTSTADAISAGIDSHSPGRRIPIASTSVPSRIGQREPVRSISRPRGMAISIGGIASSDSNSPT